MTNILFYVQHLQGVGHVFRAARIVRALVAEGFGVDVAYGGEPIDGFDIPGARIHYLPPVRAGGEVFNRLEDGEGFAAEAAEGRHLGFDGKSLIHPSQIAPCHAAFAPTDEEIGRAERLVTAATGGAERFEGEMIERMHVEAAQRLLARASRA